MSSVMFGLGLALGIAIAVLGAAFLFGKKSVLPGIVLILLGAAVALGARAVVRASTRKKSLC